MLNLHQGMRLALDQAYQAYQAYQVPVGSVLINAQGVIISASHNNRSHMLGHAEVLTLLSCQGPYVPEDSALFVTLEPCPMCAAAILNARVPKLVFGAYDPKGGAVTHGSRLLEKSNIQIIGGVLEDDCTKLLKSFFSERR